MKEKTAARRALLGTCVVVAVFALGAAVSARVRFRAWPEVLVPSYLCGRGWMLYRDVKVVHSPLLIGAVAGVSRAAGLSSWSLRILGLLPLLAVLLQLERHGRRRGWSVPALSSACVLFVLVDFAWDGNAIYPEVFLAVLAIPIYSALLRGEVRDVRRAGWLSGVALMIKQPSVFAFLFGAAWVLFRRRDRLWDYLVRSAAIPGVCLVFFTACGAGRDFLRWTVVVPLVDYRGRSTLGIQPAQAAVVVAGLLPLVGAMAVWLSRPNERRAAVLLTGLAVSFGLLAFPHFEMVHLVAAVPLIAVAAGEALSPGTGGGGPGAESPRPSAAVRFPSGSRRPAPVPPLVLAAAAATVGLAILLNGAFLATDSSAGEMSFWTSRQDDEVLSRLAALPPAPLFLYGADQNLFVRSGRLPPDRLYSNPDLWYHYLVDGLEQRQVKILRDHPETIVLRGNGAPIETPRGLLPRFLSSGYSSEEFVRGGVERLRPAGLR